MQILTKSLGHNCLMFFKSCKTAIDHYKVQIVTFEGFATSTDKFLCSSHYSFKKIIFWIEIALSELSDRFSS